MLRCVAPIACMSLLLVSTSCDQQPSKSANTTSNKQTSNSDTAAPEQFEKQKPVEQKSETVEFVFLTTVEDELKEADDAFTKEDWPEAVIHLDGARHTLNTYRNLTPPEPAAAKLSELRDRLSGLTEKLQKTAESKPKDFVDHWKQGKVYYDSLKALWELDKNSELEKAIREAQSSRDEQQKLETLRGICVYLHAPDNPLLEHHVRKTTDKLVKLPGKKTYIWSNKTGPRLSGKPWLNIRMIVHQRSQTYEVEAGELSYKKDMPTGFEIELEIESAVGIETSWHKHGKIKVPIELPKEMSFKVKDTWFPAYVESRAKHLAAESVEKSLTEILGELVIHPDAHEHLAQEAPEVTVAVARAMASHHPDRFQEVATNVLEHPGDASTAEAVPAVFRVLAESHENIVQPGVMIKALQTLSAEKINEIAEQINPLRDLANPSVLLALVSQLDSHVLLRLNANLHYAMPAVRVHALPYADGKLPATPAARQRIATYLLNFASRDRAERGAFMKEQAHWLSDEDAEFAGQMANRFVGENPETAGPILLNAIKNDGRSAVMLSKVGVFGQCPQEAEIAMKGIDLILAAPDDKTQERLATMLAVRADLSAEHWKKLFEVAKNEQLTGKSKERIVKYLKRKSDVVDESTREKLSEL